jgi:DNA processing protein
VKSEETKYLLALQLIEGVGPATLRKLVDVAGSAKAVFSLTQKDLSTKNRINTKLLDSLSNPKYLARAEEELEFCEKHSIQVLSLYDNNYPQRLKQCKDAPVILFYQGNVDLNYRKVVGIVGTRNATVYGTNLVEKLMEELAEHKHKVLIISGLAYGIDIIAHKAALKHNIPTVGVMGNGSNLIYPSQHRQYAAQMIKNGGILTEFPKGTKPERGNFVTRNRVIAGLSDALIVVESGEKGGSLITADMAFSYNRDVFAFPGKVGDPYSSGCNKLIKMQKAALIEGITDLEYVMDWAPETNVEQVTQTSLFQGLNTQERSIMELILQDGNVTIDYLSIKLGLPVGHLSGLLLNLEFKNMVKSIPGNLYTKAI